MLRNDYHSPKMTTDLLLSEIEASLQARSYGTMPPQGLYAPIDYTLSLGGKRIRPLLCLLACRLWSDDHSAAMPLAVALEVFHNFTLLHDDLMDKSSLRRGKPTVYQRWSENTAILSGDVMCIEAYRAMEGIADAQLVMQALPIFNQMAVEVCQGQEYDMEFEERRDVTSQEYMEMIRLKTAVLLGASLRLGALAGGASPEQALELDKVGQALGLAFQIQDDYLDVYGDEATFGKPIGGDIMNAKKTLMLLYTMEHLDETQRQKLDHLMSLDPSKRSERISGVRELYDLVQTPQYAQSEIERLTHEAMSILKALPVANDRLEPLLALFEGLSKRRH